jgi:hypothetical protein
MHTIHSWVDQDALAERRLVLAIRETAAAVRDARDSIRNASGERQRQFDAINGSFDRIDQRLAEMHQADR